MAKPDKARHNERISLIASNSLRQQQQQQHQPQPMVHIPRRKVACSGCRHLKAHCRQPPDSNSGDALRSCLRCLGFGLRCDLLDLDSPPASPGQHRVGLDGGVEVASRSSLAAGQLALGPSSTRGKLTSYELSNAMAYHLITSHLEGPTGVLVGNIQSFDSLKDLVDVTARKFTNKPLKLHEHDSLLALSYMIQGARHSTHSALVNPSTSLAIADSTSSSLISHNILRAQALASLEDQFIDRLSALHIEDDDEDENAAQDRIALFVLVYEAVGLTPRSRVAQAVKEERLLERAMEMTRRSVQWNESKKRDVLDWMSELLQRTHVASGDRGLPKLLEPELAQIYHKTSKPMTSPELDKLSLAERNAFAWVGTLASLDAPLFKYGPNECFLSPVYQTSSLHPSSPLLLPKIQSLLSVIQEEEDWADEAISRLERHHSEDDKEIRSAHSLLVQVERWNLYHLLAHYEKLQRSTPPQGGKAKREVMKELEVRIVSAFKKRLKGSGVTTRAGTQGKWVLGELTSDVWVLRVALERVGVEKVLGLLESDELDVLLRCFAIVARDDLDSISPVKAVEEEIIRRSTPIYDGDLAPAIVEAALADLDDAD